MFMIAESAFGRNSTTTSFVQSLYTVNVIVTNELTSHTLLTDLMFESGVGSTVHIKLDSLDLEFTRRQMKRFQ